MDTQHYKSHEYVYRYDRKSRVKNWFFGILLGMVVILFLPWTQNFRSNGLVTTLYQDQRPQQVNTIIGGQLIKWYVKEGDVVKAGDTLIQLAEVKPDYLDPALLERTAEQLEGKSQSVEFYKQKAGTATLQIEALDKGIGLKLEQLKNKLVQLELKVQADSAETIAATNDLNITRVQYERQRVMFDSGLVSLTQLEQRNQSFQSALAKKISAENKLANTKQELVITRLEINAQVQDNREKKAKADGMKAHLQETEREDFSIPTLEGGVQGGVQPPPPPTLEAKDKRIKDKSKKINDKGEIIKEEEEVAVQNCTSTVPIMHLQCASNLTHTNLDNQVGYSKTQETQAVIFPFDTENFKSAWKNWLKYRSEKRKPLKSILEQQSALKKLSQFDEEFAIGLIETSMGNGWTGLVFDKTKQQYEQYKNSRTKIGKTIDEIIRMRYQ